MDRIRGDQKLAVTGEEDENSDPEPEPQVEASPSPKTEKKKIEWVRGEDGRIRQK